MFRTCFRGADYVIGVRSCRPSMPLAAAAMIAMLAGACWPTLLPAADKPRDLCPRDEQFLRYLPDDCQAFGWVDGQSLALSEAARRANLTQSLGRLCESTRLTLSEMCQIEWVVVGTRYDAQDQHIQAVAVLRSKKPLPAAADPAAAPGWQKEKVGRFTLDVKAGPSLNAFEKPRAVCRGDDRTVLVGDPETLRAVLRRDGPTKLPERLDRARRSLDRFKPLALAMVLPERIDNPQIASLMIVREIVPRIEAIRIEGDFKADVEIRLSVDCRDGATAYEVKGIGIVACSVVQALSKFTSAGNTPGPAESARFSVKERVMALDVNVPAAAIISHIRIAAPTSAPPVTYAVEPDAPAVLAPCVPALGSPTPGAGDVLIGRRTPVPPPSTYRHASAPTASSPCYTAPVPATIAPPGTYTPAPGPAICPPPAVWDPYAAPGSLRPRPYPVTRPTPLPLMDVTDVVRMVEAKVNDQVIVRYAMKHRLKAAITADDLILLTGKGASWELLYAIQEIPVAPPGEKPSGNATSGPGRPAAGSAPLR
jgi:hypothetical protein